MEAIKSQHEAIGGVVVPFYYSFDDGDDDSKMAKVVQAIKKLLQQ
jgi:hypothetical protein